jgi:hypothetical protein
MRGLHCVYGSVVVPARVLEVVSDVLTDLLAVPSGDAGAVAKGEGLALLCKMPDGVVRIFSMLPSRHGVWLSGNRAMFIRDIIAQVESYKSQLRDTPNLPIPDVLNHYLRCYVAHDNPGISEERLAVEVAFMVGILCCPSIDMRAYLQYLVSDAIMAPGGAGGSLRQLPDEFLKNVSMVSSAHIVWSPGNRAMFIGDIITQVESYKSQLRDTPNQSIPKLLAHYFRRYVEHDNPGISEERLAGEVASMVRILCCPSIDMHAYLQGLVAAKIVVPDNASASLNALKTRVLTELRGYKRVPVRLFDRRYKRAVKEVLVDKLCASSVLVRTSQELLTGVENCLAAHANSHDPHGSSRLHRELLELRQALLQQLPHSAEALPGRMVSNRLRFVHPGSSVGVAEAGFCAQWCNARAHGPYR